MFIYFYIWMCSSRFADIYTYHIHLMFLLMVLLHCGSYLMSCMAYRSHSLLRSRCRLENLFWFGPTARMGFKSRHELLRICLPLSRERLTTISFDHARQSLDRERFYFTIVSMRIFCDVDMSWRQMTPCGREHFWKAHAVRSAIELINTMQYNTSLASAVCYFIDFSCHHETSHSLSVKER